MTVRVIELRISTFAGISSGAQHFYGDLEGYDAKGNFQRVELLHILTAEQAERENKYRRQVFAPYYAEQTRSRAGQETKGFESEADVRAAAVAQWKKFFPRGTVLVEDGSQVEIGRALDGPPKLVSKINALYAEAKAVGFWEGDSRKMRSLSRHYDDLLEDWD